MEFSGVLFVLSGAVIILECHGRHKVPSCDPSRCSPPKCRFPYTPTGLCCPICPRGECVYGSVGDCGGRKGLKCPSGTTCTFAPVGVSDVTGKCCRNIPSRQFKSQTKVRRPFSPGRGAIQGSGPRRNCNKVTCPQMECPNQFTPPGSCCPICRVDQRQPSNVCNKATCPRLSCVEQITPEGACCPRCEDMPDVVSNSARRKTASTGNGARKSSNRASKSRNGAGRSGSIAGGSGIGSGGSEKGTNGPAISGDRPGTSANGIGSDRSGKDAGRSRNGAGTSGNNAGTPGKSFGFSNNNKGNPEYEVGSSRKSVGKGGHIVGTKENRGGMSKSAADPEILDNVVGRPNSGAGRSGKKTGNSGHPAIISRTKSGNRGNLSNSRIDPDLPDAMTGGQKHSMRQSGNTAGGHGHPAILSRNSVGRSGNRGGKSNTMVDLDLPDHVTGGQRQSMPSGNTAGISGNRGGISNTRIDPDLPDHATGGLRNGIDRSGNRAGSYMHPSILSRNSAVISRNRGGLSNSRIDPDLPDAGGKRNSIDRSGGSSRHPAILSRNSVGRLDNNRGSSNTRIDPDLPDIVVGGQSNDAARSGNTAGSYTHPPILSRNSVGRSNLRGNNADVFGRLGYRSDGTGNSVDYTGYVTDRYDVSTNVGQALDPCAQYTCPSLYCVDQYIPAGQCCPVCVTGCNVNGLRYDEGDSVPSYDTCAECYCSQGDVTCQYKQCEFLYCDDSHVPPGECCPKCPENNGGA